MFKKYIRNNKTAQFSLNWEADVHFTCNAHVYYKLTTGKMHLRLQIIMKYLKINSSFTDLIWNEMNRYMFSFKTLR
jgi:hypothetical protein